MAVKMKKRQTPLQIYGVVTGSVVHCNQELSKRIETFIRNHNEQYPKRSDWLKHGIKWQEIVHYQYSLSDQNSNAYRLSYIVNFYR